jgi:hypothetical protein
MSDNQEKEILPPSPQEETNQEEENLSPKEKHFAKLNKAKLKYNAIAYTLEMGVEDSDDEEDEEENEESEDDQPQVEKEYTDEEMAKLRHVLLTERRAKLITEMEVLMLGDQHQDLVKSFNTSYSNHIISAVPQQIIFASAKALPEQFDHVFGITKAIQNYDNWMYDYDEYNALQNMLDLLAETWKGILSHSNEELEIDMEYTRPGIEKMLQNFEKLLINCEEPFDLNWY